MLKAVAARGGTFGVVKSNSFLYEKTANIYWLFFHTSIWEMMHLFLFQMSDKEMVWNKYHSDTEYWLAPNLSFGVSF